MARTDIKNSEASADAIPGKNAAAVDTSLPTSGRRGLLRIEPEQRLDLIAAKSSAARACANIAGGEGFQAK
jgi:hypothetical protein